MIVQPNSKLLMMGASITDSERVRPVGEGHPGSLGKGYVSFVDAYGAAARQIAQKHQAIFVDTEAAFDAVLTQLHPMVLALDRIHPTHVRHIVITWAFLDAIGYEWN